MNQMKLSDFIAQTIIEIVDGVRRAQEDVKDKGAVINPTNVNWSDTKKGFFMMAGAVPGRDQAPLLTPIDFDILLTIGEDDQAQGSIGIFAAALGVGLKGKISEHTEAVNRIRFQILSKLPQQR